MSEELIDNFIMLVEASIECIEKEEKDGEIDEKGRKIIIDIVDDIELDIKIKNEKENDLIDDPAEVFEAYRKCVEEDDCEISESIWARLGEAVITRIARVPLPHLWEILCNDLKPKLLQETGDKIFTSITDELKKKEREDIKYKPFLDAMMKIEERCSNSEQDN